MALKNPRLRFTVVPPSPGKPFERNGEVSGYVTSRDKLVTLLLHPWPEGSKITNLRAVDKSGKDLAEQPAELQEEKAVAPAVVTAPKQPVPVDRVTP